VVVRGSTIVDIEPRGEFGAIHSRPDLRREDAPTRTGETMNPMTQPIEW
jgi:hypothetical protein